VDDVDAVDELGDPAECLHDEPFLVERRDDDRDALPVEHYSAAAAAFCRRRAAIGSTASATIAPISSPMMPPTRSAVRFERALERTPVAGCTTRLSSTFRARFRSCCESYSCVCRSVRRASAVVMTEFRLALSRRRVSSESDLSLTI